MKNWLHNFLLFFCVFFTTFSYAQQENNLIAKGEKLNLIADGYSFTEGPASDASGNVYFTDQPNDRILKWDATTNAVETFMQPSGHANGLYLDAEGNIIATADEQTQLWRIATDKKVDTLIGTFKNKNFNGPNDLWIDPDGGIYFTDPYYQRPWWNYETQPQKEKRVYFLPKNSRNPVIVAQNLTQPNGIIGTPDGKQLYVSDIDATKIYRYDIASDGSLKNRMLLANEKSDGMTIDNRGNIYLSGDGVIVLDKTGKRIAHIEVPQNWTANVTFGGKDHKTLFITASEAVYSLKMKVSGVQW